MKLTCLISLSIELTEEKHCDPPEAHSAIIYPLGPPLFRGKNQFVQ